MELREKLSEYTKEALLEMARQIGLRRYSSLRKAALVDLLAKALCDEEVLRTRLACLTNEQLNLLRRACKEPQDIGMNEIMDSMILCKYCIGSFDEETDLFCVFEEIATNFSRIDDEVFRADQCKKGWMVKCISFSVNYYGIAPIEAIYKIYKQKVRGTIDEMIDMLWGMPIDMIDACLLSMDDIGMDGWPKEDPLYSSKGVLLQVELLEGTELVSLLRAQNQKEFYIPTKKQVDEIYQRGYEASTEAYKKLESFFMKKLHLSYKKAVAFCLQIYANSYKGELPSEMINKIGETGVVFETEEVFREFIGLLMDAHNNTRLRENRGHKPNELFRKDFINGMPTIVPGDSNAAMMLKEATPLLQDMGFELDMDSNADVIHTTMFPNGLNGEAIKAEKKIYPNDPCPCGSGRKYKKCCGRR